MAELFGRKTGCSGGLAGSMHLFDRERRFMGGYAIVGETFPVATGVAYAITMRELPEAYYQNGKSETGTSERAFRVKSAS